MSIWIPPQLADMREHGRSLSYQDYCVFYLGEFPWNCGSAGLWAWRGHIARKLLGRMPTPEEVDLPADSSYWEPDLIETTQTHYADGRKGPVEYWRRGRRLKADGPAVRRYLERRARS